ncbi:MAG TPA: amidase family protein [Polyangiaceae bacterium]|nr:amidase family protein [Polyangiaceae bacterium]
MNTDEYAKLDATAQARLVAEKKVSPKELVEAAIARIERLDGPVNSVVTKQYEKALERAEGPLPSGPFRGVPFLLKDLSGGGEKGSPLTLGSRLLAKHVAEVDTELVRRFRDAGLVFVGRTNTPELGIPPTTEPLLFGPCKNPWNLAHSSGGSSGGAAAAVALRLVPFAHASDAGGSIRIPASCCGLFGLKPTRARSPMGPKLGESTAGLIAELCVSVSVRDSAALLDAIEGPDVGDPYAAPAKLRPFLSEVTAKPSKLRIAVMRTAVNGAPVDPECLAAVDSAAALCRELGHEVVDEQFELADPASFFTAFVTVWSVSAAVNVRSIEALAGRPAGPEDIEPVTRALADMGNGHSGPDFVLAQRTLHRASREIARFFVDHDVVLSPTLARPPALLGDLVSTPDSPLAGFFKAGGYAAFTPVYNVTGQPAMSVPLHWSKDGLPIGVQFAGRFGDDGTLLRLAAELERARPWAGKTPPGVL